MRVSARRRVHAEGVVALLHETLPPGALDIVFNFHAHGSVVPRVAHAAVNFAAGEDDAPCLAKAHKLVHRYRSFFHFLAPISITDILVFFHKFVKRSIVKLFNNP